MTNTNSPVVDNLTPPNRIRILEVISLHPTEQVQQSNVPFSNEARDRLIEAFQFQERANALFRMALLMNGIEIPDEPLNPENVEEFARGFDEKNTLHIDRGVMLMEMILLLHFSQKQSIRQQFLRLIESCINLLHHFSQKQLRRQQFLRLIETFVNDCISISLDVLFSVLFQTQTNFQCTQIHKDHSKSET